MDEDRICSERIAAIEQRAKSNSHRLDKLEEDTAALHQIATAVEVTTKELEFIRKGQDDTNNRLDDTNNRLAAIEKKPAARMEQIITAVIVAIVGICVGYLFGGGI